MRGECENPNKEGCPIAELKGGCFSDTDHIYWPASDYTSTLERTFRELPENKQQLCRWEHVERHATEEPPIKPSQEVMNHAVEQAHAIGEIVLSATKQKRLGL